MFESLICFVGVLALVLLLSLLLNSIGPGDVGFIVHPFCDDGDEWKRRSR